MKVMIDIDAEELYKRLDAEGNSFGLILHEPKQDGSFSVLICPIISIENSFKSRDIDIE